MERLTKRSTNGTGIYNTPSGDPVEWENNRHRVLQKLADYEDLEEQGLLLKLPCKVGDTVYCIEDNKVNKFVVYSFDIRPLQQFVCNYGGIRLNFKNFGKTIFLTKEQAEENLKESEV